MATAAVQSSAATHHFLPIESGPLASSTGKSSTASTSVATFNCGICFDSFPEGVVSRIRYCGHSFCRPCLLQYLQSKLAERRPPIICPTCSAQCTSTGSEPTVISTDMVSQLRVSLSATELATWAELEMMCYSVLLSCAQCNKSFFVNKEKYEAQSTIPCPLIPGCKHSWCKACSKWIDPAGPKHSCDGSSELNHLITKEGWKRCPGCHTPTSKIDGCNEISCITPGCNVRFCYHCGQVIIRSVSATDPQRMRAKQEHFAKCRAY